MSTLEHKVLKNKKLEKDLILKITKSEAAERIFVEFASKDGKMRLQRSFQDNYLGRRDAAVFESMFKNLDELKAHFKRGK